MISKMALEKEVKNVIFHSKGLHNKRREIPTTQSGRKRRRGTILTVRF